MDFARVQEDAFAIDKQRVFIPSNLFVKVNISQLPHTFDFPFFDLRLTISCNGPLLYGLIKSVGDVYPTALAAPSTARHPSAIAPPAKPFILFYSVLLPSRKVEINGRKARSAQNTRTAGKEKGDGNPSINIYSSTQTQLHHPYYYLFGSMNYSAPTDRRGIVHGLSARVFFFFA